MCLLPHALIGGSKLTRAATGISEVGVSFGGASELTRVAVRLVGATGVVLDDSGGRSIYATRQNIMVLGSR